MNKSTVAEYKKRNASNKVGKSYVAMQHRATTNRQIARNILRNQSQNNGFKANWLEQQIKKFGESVLKVMHWACSGRSKRIRTDFNQSLLGVPVGVMSNYSGRSSYKYSKSPRKMGGGKNW